MSPKIHPSAYIAPTAVIVGDVTIEEGVSVWDGAVLRGDVSYIRVEKTATYRTMWWCTYPMIFQR